MPQIKDSTPVEHEMVFGPGKYRILAQITFEDARRTPLFDPQQPDHFFWNQLADHFRVPHYRLRVHRDPLRAVYVIAELMI